MAEKTYIPGVYIRAKQTQYGELLNVSMDAQKLIAFLTANKDERGFVKMAIGPRKEPKDDITHSAWLDTWKPTGQGPKPVTPAPVAPPADAPPLPEDDVPF